MLIFSPGRFSAAAAGGGPAAGVETPDALSVASTDIESRVTIGAEAT